MEISSRADCSFKPPVANISNSSKFSDKLAKRKIYEWLLTNNKSSSKRIGVNFLIFMTGASYTNSISISDKIGLIQKNIRAPAGALLYPAKAKYRLCKEAGNKILTSIVEGNFCCYRNGKGAWECSPDN